MTSLADDLERFAAMWLPTPHAKLDFATLISRCTESGTRIDPTVHDWIAAKFAVAKAMGIK